jgi:hypothetical protein
MSQEWSEQGALPHWLTVTFEGINQDAKDQLDIENFARGAKAPSKEDPGGKAFAHTAQLRARALSPRDVATLGLAGVFGLLGWIIPSELGARSEVASGVGIGAAVFGGLLLTLIDFIRGQQAKPVTRSVEDRFTLTLSRATFTCAGAEMPEQRFEVSAIESFAGDAALSLRLADGKTVTLPCRLPSRLHGPLAERLNGALQEAKAQP